MSAVQQRARIARVRRIQHGLAASAAAKALGHVQLLEGNQQRLGAMRDGLGAEQGSTTGWALAGRGELTMRLEAARDSLGTTIAGARAAAGLREQARIGARRQQESAEKLEKQAVRAAEEAEAVRGAAPLRPRASGPTRGDAE